MKSPSYDKSKYVTSEPHDSPYAFTALAFAWVSKERDSGRKVRGLGFAERHSRELEAQLWGVVRGPFQPHRQWIRLVVPVDFRRGAV